MIYDFRKYTCRVGMVQRQMAFYRDHGLQVQTRYLGDPVVFGVAESGNVNSYVHVWKFEDAADQDRRRATLYADPEWMAFLKKSGKHDYLLSQESTILTAPDFMIGR